MQLFLMLPLHNQGQLDALLGRLYDPKDPLYGHYITPDEFTQQFGASQSEVDAVVKFANANGLTVEDVASNRSYVQVSGSSGSVETAFAVRINDYTSPDGRRFYSADCEPSIAANVAPYVSGIVGLNDNAVGLHSSEVANSGLGLLSSVPQLHFSGNAGLTLSDIRTLYGLTNLSYHGSGQIVALFEVGACNLSEFGKYDSTYVNSGIKPLLIGVNNYNTNSTPDPNTDEEITLDMDMIDALSPGISQLRVYENDPKVGTFDADLIASFNAIANDKANLANVVSVSYSAPEYQVAKATRLAENVYFQQMAAQGQSVCVSTGDAGAYADGSNLTISDPSSQPYVTSVGGTDLTPASTLVWAGESSWGNSSTKQGGGGGYSSHWALPIWQTGAFSSSSNPQGSLSRRNIPDVSLYADPDSAGYDVYLSVKFSKPGWNGPGWYGLGGTSASAPLWAAFFADVNEARITHGLGPLGFANPALYAIAKNPAQYANDFHDITNGSNLHYSAVPGYDNSTGLGTIKGMGLFTDLTHSVQYNLIDLGTFGGTTSEGKSVNDSGQVTGDATIAGDTADHAFVYSQGTMRDLGTLGGSYSEGHGINNNGQVTGFASLSGDVTTHAFLFSSGSMQDLGTLGGSYSEGNGINAVGQVAGDATIDNNPSYDINAFLYSSGKMIDLADFSTTLQGLAEGINSGGQVTGAVQSDYIDGFLSAFIYSNGVYTGTGSLGGDTSFGRGINASGSVTGYASLPADIATHAFLYSTGSMTDLGTLGGSGSDGFGINVSGQVVGSSQITGDTANHAFLYSNGAMRDLNALTDPAAGWTLESATAISDTGYITGYGTTISGSSHAFLLIPKQLLPTNPTITSLSQSSVTVLTAFTLTVNGANFLPGAQVFWNTTALPTKFVSATQLTAVVTTVENAALGLYPGAAAITVRNTNATLSNFYNVTVVAPPLPPVPTGLVATPGNAKVMLAWTASAGATSYSIYRGTTSYGQSATPIATGVTAATFLNTGLTKGTTYYYRVAAFNAGGNSAEGNQAAATPPTAPAIPTGLTATAGNAKVTLVWIASVGATSYNIYRGTNSYGQSATPIATGVNATTFTNTGLTNGTTYYYRVAAFNAGGNSAEGNQAVATPVAPPAVPTGLMAAAGTGSVTLSWIASAGATSYSVYRGTTSFGQSATPIATGVIATTYTNTLLTHGTTYFYRIAAFNAGGNSAEGNQASATP